MKFKMFSMLYFLITAQMTFLDGKIWNKVDIGPAFVHIDILTSGHTTKRMDMWAVRGDSAISLWRCLYLKPTVLYGHGGTAKGGVFNAGAALSCCLPYNEWLSIAPQIGLTYCHLWTKINFPHFKLNNIKERFKSYSPYIGLELYFTLCKGTRLCLGMQYSKSFTKTTIEMAPRSIKDKSHSMGPVYTVQLEHDLSTQWSVNIGAAYNISLSKEKHGLRAAGVKAGLAYWF